MDLLKWCRKDTATSSKYTSPQLIPNHPADGLFFKTNLKIKDPYRFYTWNVTYGDIYPLGVKQQDLKAILDSGRELPFPDGLVINGRGANRYTFTVDQADTPLKLADYFNISGVFSLGIIPYAPTGGGAYLQTSVMAADHRSFVEIVFENPEDTVQSWHIDGHSFFVVGMDRGQWTPACRLAYNLRDTISRCTVQYLGQQFYLRVFSAANSWRDEYPIPRNALLCGRAIGRRTPPTGSH
ncbi:hypothetical protein V6N13_099418 [Hibiscus sabdariffa]